MCFFMSAEKAYKAAAKRARKEAKKRPKAKIKEAKQIIKKIKSVIKQNIKTKSAIEIICYTQFCYEDVAEIVKEYFINKGYKIEKRKDADDPIWANESKWVVSWAHFDKGGFTWAGEEI